MAIRRLLFPEATVSQSASYCLTARLWCRAQTLSPTPPTPPPPDPSLLCWFSELLFLSENLNEASERKETRERGRARRRGAQRARAKRERKTVILLKRWSMLPACVCSARCQKKKKKKEGYIDLLPHFNQKKWVLNRRFSFTVPQITRLSTNKEHIP